MPRKASTAKRGLALAAAMATVLAMTSLSGMAAHATITDNPLPSPGWYGTPQPDTLVWYEDFENIATDTAKHLEDYVGESGETYTSDPSWGSNWHMCNGWILSANTTDAPSSADDAGCGSGGGRTGNGNTGTTNTQTAWWFLQRMAAALGQAQNMDDPSSNNAVSSETNGSNTQEPGWQLKTGTEDTGFTVVPAVPGHYYQVSIWLAESHCSIDNPSWKDSSELIYLIYTLGDGVPVYVLLSDPNGYNACSGTNYPQGENRDATPVYVSQFKSFDVQMPEGATALGLGIYNQSGESTGNDVAFDTPEIYDVTPQLDKAFSPSEIEAGQTSTLTFTITSTDSTDVNGTLFGRDEDGMRFTDNLPTGLVVGPDGLLDTDCPGALGADEPTITASPGSDTISVADVNLNEGQTSCTVNVQVTSDVAGSFVNGPANITGLFGLLPPGPVTLTVDPPTLSIVKTVTPTTLSAAGDVTYQFVVTNDGYAPIDNLAIDDTDFSGINGPLGTIECSPVALGGTLDGSTSTTCEVGYTVSQTELDLGDDITNSATATGTYSCLDDDDAVADCQVASDPDTAIVAMSPNPAISLTKSVASGSTALHEGDTLKYLFVVENTGNVTLTDVGVTEGTFTGSGTAPTPTCPDTADGYAWPGTAGTLKPHQTVTCSASYVVTAEDAAAGSIENSATATGTPPLGPDVTSDDTAEAPTVPDPAITLDKQHVALTGTAQAGDDVTYTFTVKNAGNVPVDTIAVSDAKVGTVTCPGTGFAWPSTTNPGVLESGQSVTCTGTYTLTQADIDAGKVDNSATATAVSITSTPTPVEDTDTDTIAGLDAPHLSLVKSADPADGTALDVGGNIDYSFLVTNDGNTTITDLSVDELSFSGTGTPAPSVTCPTDATDWTSGVVGQLEPYESITCTADYQLTQDDLDARSLANNAQANGLDAQQVNVPSNESDVSVPLGRPSIDLTETATLHGSNINYSFTVTNTGNTNLQNVILIQTGFTGKGPAPTVNCPKTVLAPQEKMICTAVYPLRSSDYGTTILNPSTVSSVPARGLEQPTANAGADITLPRSGRDVNTGGALASSSIAPYALASLLTIGGAVILIWRRRQSLAA